MFFKDVLNLISITTTGKTETGRPITAETLREVFADVESVRQSEFYQAQSVGMKPEIMFSIRQGDYNNETTLEYESTRYSIIRTYSIDGEIIELICSRVVLKNA